MQKISQSMRKILEFYMEKTWEIWESVRVTLYEVVFVVMWELTWLAHEEGSWFIPSTILMMGGAMYVIINHFISNFLCFKTTT